MKEIGLTAPDENGAIRLVNIDKIQEWLVSELERFGGVVYTAETLSEAKQDRNALNQTKSAFERTKSVIRQKRKETSDPVGLESLDEAERQVNELLRSLERPLRLVQEYIDYCGEEMRNQRRRELMSYARNEASARGEIGRMLLSSPAFWEKSWDQPSMSIKRCRIAIRQRFDDAVSDIAALCGSEDSAALIVRYIETMSMADLEEYRRKLSAAAGVVVERQSDDNVVGYKVIRIDGRGSDLRRIIGQLELMGAEYRVIEDGMPKRPTERIEPDFEDFVAFDFETSGSLGVVSGDGLPEITEIGAVKVVGGEIVGSFSELCNPGRKITPVVVELTGITDEMVADKPPVGEVVRRFIEFIGAFPLVGHGIKDSDLIFLERAARREGIAIGNEYFDTYSYAKRVKQRYSLDGMGLEALARRFEVPQPEAHRALADAEVTVGVYDAFRKLRLESRGGEAR